MSDKSNTSAIAAAAAAAFVSCRIFKCLETILFDHKHQHTYSL